MTPSWWLVNANEYIRPNNQLCNNIFKRSNLIPARKLKEKAFQSLVFQGKKIIGISPT
jgi:hypothetical protein